MKTTSVLLLILPAILSAQNMAIGEYEVPTYGSRPYSITVGPDGALWFTEPGYFRIGRLTTAGAFTEYPINSLNGVPNWITAGPDGALWFTLLSGLNGSFIGRITTAGVISYYPIGSGYYGTDPTGITTGPDGALWFTLAADSSNTVGRMTTTGAVTVLPVPGSRNGQIMTGPDGALWFAGESINGLGRVTTSGAVTWFGVFANGITAGPDGAIWFTASSANSIGRMTLAGAVTEYPIPTPNSSPVGITTGPDGALWFTEYQAGKLGRITTAGVVTEYPMPNCPCLPQGITTGPDREMWFADQSGRIAEGVFVNATLTASPGTGYYRSPLTFTGSGYAPGESVRIYTAGVGSAVLTSATADGTGSFSATGPAPASPFGSRIFLGVGQNSRKLGAASFSISPHLYLSPSSGPVGTTVTVTGFGFQAFAGQPGVYWSNPRTRLAITAPVDSHGTIYPLTITVPAGALPGANQIFAWNGPSEPIGWGLFTVQ